MEVTMIRLVAVAFVLAVATSAQAMSPVPLHQPDGMTMQVQARVPRQVPPWCDYTPGQVRVYGCPRCGRDGICMYVVPPLTRHRARRDADPGY